LIENIGSWLSLYGNTTTYLARGIAVSQLLLLPNGMETSKLSKVRASIAIKHVLSKLTFSIRIDSMLFHISIGAVPSKYIDFDPQWRR
jgi:hypothetical protein